MESVGPGLTGGDSAEARFLLRRGGAFNEGPFTLEQLRVIVLEERLLPHHTVKRVDEGEATDALVHPATAGFFRRPSELAEPPPIPGKDWTLRDAKFGGLLLRSIAFLVDLCLASLLAAALVFGIAFVLGLGIAAGNAPGMMIGVFCGVYIVPLIVGWVYSAAFESSRWQATPGKRMFGLKVVGSMGEPITFFQATGRYLGKWLSGSVAGIGYLIAAFSERKQALHDMLAGTYVVVRRSGDRQ